MDIVQKKKRKLKDLNPLKRKKRKDQIIFSSDPAETRYFKFQQKPYFKLFLKIRKRPF